MGRNCRFLQGPKTDPERRVAKIRQAIELGEDVHGAIVELHKDRGRSFGTCSRWRPCVMTRELYVFLRAYKWTSTAHDPSTEDESIAEITFKGTDEENIAISKGAASMVAGATAKDKEFEPPWVHMHGKMHTPKPHQIENRRHWEALRKATNDGTRALTIDDFVPVKAHWTRRRGHRALGCAR